MKTKILFIIAGVSAVLSCEKETPKPSIIGEYCLYDAVWCADPVDWDGNGYYNTDVFLEFINMPGYYEPFHTAYVSKAIPFDRFQEDKDIISFNLRLPYPKYISKDENIVVSGVDYINMTLRVSDIDEPSLDSAKINSKYSDDMFLNSINEIYISQVYDDGFEVCVSCSQTDDEYGMLKYIYRKSGQ